MKSDLLVLMMQMSKIWELTTANFLFAETEVLSVTRDYDVTHKHNNNKTRLYFVLRGKLFQY